MCLLLTIFDLAVFAADCAVSRTMIQLYTYDLVTCNVVYIYIYIYICVCVEEF